jgi:hypothetical protein
MTNESSPINEFNTQSFQKFVNYLQNEFISLYPRIKKLILSSEVKYFYHNNSGSYVFGCFALISVIFVTPYYISSILIIGWGDWAYSIPLLCLWLWVLIDQMGFNRKNAHTLIFNFKSNTINNSEKEIPIGMLDSLRIIIKETLDGADNKIFSYSLQFVCKESQFNSIFLAISDRNLQRMQSLGKCIINALIIGFGHSIPFDPEPQSINVERSLEYSEK